MDKFETAKAYLKKHAKANFVPIIRPKSAKILGELIKTALPKRILEIGTATGFSALIMLENAPCATLTTIEKNETRLALAKNIFETCDISSRVTTILGDANEEVKRLNGKFDFIFLDGPKSHYGKQFPYLIKHLEANGTLVCDNVLFMNEVLSGKYPAHKHRTAIFRMREFLEMVKDCPQIESKLIEIEDGLLVCKKIGGNNE
ncbi:MAG: O-methyltransferase [Clostridia bacterium]|nr:O-methyltransferase [Clostridia bacterium]